MLSSKEKKSSKYDLYQVWVHFPDGKGKYVLSRYIVARILMVTGIKRREGFRIGMELKKELVDQKKKEITQQEFEDRLFKILEKRNHKKRIEAFQRLSRFYNERVPVLILFFGTGCIGKSTIADEVSEVLNIPAVLHTEIVLKLWKFANSQNPKEEEGTFSTKEEEVWKRKFEDSKEGEQEFIREYQKQSEIVRQCLEGDIQKCFKNGKNIIITGNDLDPKLFEDVIERFQLKEKGDLEKQKGLILPFLVRNDSHQDVYINQYMIRDRIKGVQHETLRKNFNTLEKYLNEIKLSYKMLEINSGFTEMKKTIQIIRKKFLDEIQKYDEMIKS